MGDAGATKLRRQQIGLRFPGVSTSCPPLTARGNIAIAQYIHGDGYDPHRFDVVDEMLGLEGRLHHRPSEMSGGEQQRVPLPAPIITSRKSACR